MNSDRRQVRAIEHFWLPASVVLLCFGLALSTAAGTTVNWILTGVQAVILVGFVVLRGKLKRRIVEDGDEWGH